MHINQVNYVIKHMMGENWKYEDGMSILPISTLEIFDLCESRLELMYLLGALHQLQLQTWYPFMVHPIKLTNESRLEELTMRGVGIGGTSELWDKKMLSDGPEHVLFIPQYPSPDGRLHHDFGIIFVRNDIPEFAFAVEIDGYGVHKSRRSQDQMRDAHVPYPVIRVSEEHDKPQTWFEKYVINTGIGTRFLNTDIWVKWYTRAIELEPRIHWLDLFDGSFTSEYTGGALTFVINRERYLPLVKDSHVWETLERSLCDVLGFAVRIKLISIYEELGEAS